MIAELGLCSLILALAFAMLLVIVPSIGIFFRKAHYLSSTKVYVFAHFVFIGLGFLFLTVCFLRDDFTVTYVLMNSSRSLPWFYKFCAVWGGHEGSMLLWVFILSFWMVLVQCFSQSLTSDMRARVLVVLSALSIGFLLFLLMTSNPFSRQFQLLDSPGRDLNPLLQDPGFLFHPPMLYMGYVGFSVPFSFAMASLWLGRVDASFVKWTRPWTLASWCCLTLGITLGSWWAYRELGWGGWWFWDPVENASFMPWLVGTALIHSLLVCEKRRQFMSWTLLLSITAFSLSLVGTFLVRSGVLTSVHAFAVSPTRGLYILIFLLVVIGGALSLFAIRAQSLQKVQHPALVSRESALLLNNIFLLVAMLTVLMGTLYPLIIDGLNLGKLSVGAPYFNTVFVPLMMPLFFLMGLGIHLKWQKDSLKSVFFRLKFVLAFSVLLPLIYVSNTLWLGLSMAFWIVLSTLKKVWEKRDSLSQAFLGMVTAHLGVAVTVIGITISTGFGLQKDLKLSKGMTTEFAGFHLTLMNEAQLLGPNYHGSRVEVRVEEGQHSIYPEKRIYDVGQMPMTESAIDVTPFRDLYIALGEPLDKDAWSLRLYYKPFVRWIWGGGVMMLIGGIFAMLDRRYYR